MDHHQPGPSQGTLLHDFNPAKPFVTSRSRTALGHLHDAFAQGRSLAILDGGWNRGTKQLVQRFLTEVGSGVSMLRVPGSCSTEMEAMGELVGSIGFHPKDSTAADLRKIFGKYLQFQKKRGRRTVLIMEESSRQNEWAGEFITGLVELETKAKLGLTVILIRQTKFNQLDQELPLDSLSYRTAKHIALTPFTQAETRKFIRWRIDAAESADIACIFDFQAITLIHELCEGVPDAIDHLCWASLELADEEDTAPVSTAIVMRASKDLPAKLLIQQPRTNSQLNTPQTRDIPILELPDCPTIVLTYNGKAIRQLRVNKQRISIGRLPDNDLCIDSPFISRQHATIFRNGAETAVVDLDSKNGTFVNSRRILIQTIADQDEISIGYHTIKFLDPNAPRMRSLNAISADRPANSGNARRESQVSDIDKAVRARR